MIKKVLIFITFTTNLYCADWKKEFQTFDYKEKKRAVEEILNLFLLEVNPKTIYEPPLNSILPEESKEKIKNLIKSINVLFVDVANRDYDNKFDKITQESCDEYKKLSIAYLNALSKAKSDAEKVILTNNYSSDQIKIAKAYKEKVDKAKSEIKIKIINYYFNCYKYMTEGSNYNPIPFIKLDKNNKDQNPITIAPELRSKL